jgi:type IV secretory pathway VirB6-like protein
MLGVGATVGVTALIGMLMLIMFSYGVGLVILFAVIYLMVTAFFSVLRFFQIYLMAFMAFSFMMALGYVFVPLLLFKNTFTYFQKWMTTCVAYLLVPVVMYGYMGMMLIALDVTLISGDFSVMREIFGPKAVTAMNADDPNTNPSTRIKCPVNGSNDGNGTFCNNNHKSVFSLGIATNATQIKTDGGVFGSLNDIGESATNFLSETHGNMIDAGFDYLEADVTEMALQQGENKTNEQYLIDVALSSCIASLIAYIMFSLMGYIPELASGLVSQGTHAGAHVAKAEVFGQATVMKSMDVAKQAAMAYFSGGGSLLKSAGGIAAKTMSRK